MHENDDGVRAEAHTPSLFTLDLLRPHVLDRAWHPIAVLATRYVVGPWPRYRTHRFWQAGHHVVVRASTTMERSGVAHRSHGSPDRP